ncbi:MAG: glycosyltransferase family 39 protein [Hyphomonadaceae bacterium]
MNAGTLFATPERGLLALMVAQLVFWTLAPALSHSAPPLDVVEMYAWGREGVVATFKHPNLPGLVLEPTRWLLGAGWPAYLVSQIFIAVTFAAVFALGRDLMDAPRALAGALLLTGVYFFSWVTPEFNHNVAQMPLWALVMLLLWRASTHDKWLDWLLLGLVAGFSLWAKYSSGVLLVVAAVWMVWDEQARKRILSPGPWITFAAFLAAAAPQALWLIDHDYGPFAYAARRASDGEWYAPIEFLLTLALDHLPMLILLACAGFFGKPAEGAPAKPEQRALRYLLLMGLGPALLTAVGAAFTGASLRASWGAPMVALSGLIVMALLSAKFSADRLKRLGLGAGVLIVVVSGLYYAHMAYGVAFTGKPLRGNWPQAEISATLEQVWREETNNAPLRIVAGDIWTGGLIGLHDRNPPSVLINGDFSAAPWVTPEELERYGALVVWSGGQPAALAEFMQGLEQREWEYRPRFGSDYNPKSIIRIHYAVIPPNTWRR